MGLAAAADRPATYGDVFAVPEFRALWVAQMLSLLGDQLARVALVVLVFQRTGSPALTAAAYAVTFLPWLVGGPLLAGLADHLPRRDVLIGCDLIRAGLLGVMAIPHVPIALLCVLVFAAELLEPPFSAARAALLPDVLPDDRYVLASAVSSITREAGQLLGFAAGGALVLAVHPQGALVLDAGTFLLSALFLTVGVRPRSAPVSGGKVRPPLRHVSRGVRAISGDPALRALVGLAWLCAFYVIPEGLAAPLAAQLHAGPLAVGLLMAANPAGTVFGSFLLARFVAPVRRLRLMPTLAVLSVAPLLGCVLRPPLIVLFGLLLLSGVGSSYNLPANAAFVAAVPADVRGQAFGVVQSGMYVGQGVAVAVGGLLAQVLDPFLVVALGGAVGLAVALWLSRTVSGAFAGERAGDQVLVR